MRIEQGHLPARRRLGGVDTVIASLDADILHLVTHVEYARLTFSHIHIDVLDEAVLGVVRAEAYGVWIALADTQVDVGDGTVEGACGGILGCLSVMDGV